MRKKLIAAMLCGLFLFGCKMSIDVATWFHPGYSSTTKVQRDELLGTWINRKDELRVEIAKAEKGTYEFIFMEGGGISAFEGVLFELKGQLLVDLLPAVKDKEKMSNLFMIPTHIFARITVKDDSIKMDFLDFFWLVKHLKANKGKAQFAERDGRVLITEPTKKVRKLLEEFLDNKDAFTVSTVLESMSKKDRPAVVEPGK